MDDREHYLLLREALASGAMIMVQVRTKFRFANKSHRFCEAGALMFYFTYHSSLALKHMLLQTVTFFMFFSSLQIV